MAQQLQSLMGLLMPDDNSSSETNCTFNANGTYRNGRGNNRGNSRPSDFPPRSNRLVPIPSERADAVAQFMQILDNFPQGGRSSQNDFINQIESVFRDLVIPAAEGISQDVAEDLFSRQTALEARRQLVRINRQYTQMLGNTPNTWSNDLVNEIYDLANTFPEITFVWYSGRIYLISEFRTTNTRFFERVESSISNYMSVVFQRVFNDDVSPTNFVCFSSVGDEIYNAWGVLVRYEMTGINTPTFCCGSAPSVYNPLNGRRNVATGHPIVDMCEGNCDSAVGFTPMTGGRYCRSAAVVPTGSTGTGQGAPPPPPAPVPATQLGTPNRGRK